MGHRVSRARTASRNECVRVPLAVESVHTSQGSLLCRNGSVYILIIIIKEQSER